MTFAVRPVAFDEGRPPALDARRHVAPSSWPRDAADAVAVDAPPAAEADADADADADAWARYESALIDVVRIDRSRHVTMRPVLARDVPLLVAFYRALGRQTLQRRLQCGFGGLSDERIRALTLQGIARHPAHLVLVAVEVDDALHERIVGHAGWVVDADDALARGLPADGAAGAPSRAATDDGEACGPLADFAIVVADDLQRSGVGLALMRALGKGASLRGLDWLRGSVRADNLGMLALAKRLGFWCAPLPDDDGLIEVLGRVERAGTPRAGPPARRDRWLRGWARLNRRVDAGAAR